MYHSLAVLPIDYYWTVEPDIETYEAQRGVGSLADDLTDIYLDLKDGLNGLLAGQSERDVVFDWRLTSWIHSGFHAVDAMVVIHRAIQRD